MNKTPCKGLWRAVKIRVFFEDAAKVTTHRNVRVRAKSVKEALNKAFKANPGCYATMLAPEVERP